MESTTQGLAHSVGFEVLGDDLARDVEAALRLAIDEKVVFPAPPDPLTIFQKTLATSIREVDTDPRGRLFQRFLRDGPYEKIGAIPADLIGKRLTDDETAVAIAFIYSHMVNSFKGSLAELLAIPPCIEILGRLQRAGKLPSEARIYHGDSITVRLPNRSGTAKGADLHILVNERGEPFPEHVLIMGVVEVKSYIRSQLRLRRQLARHLSRTIHGLCIADPSGGPNTIVPGVEVTDRPAMIGVVPASWKLPREFHFDMRQGKRQLRVEAGSPPNDGNQIVQSAPDEWRVTLRWSQEALAAAAYLMTFWYMEKVGEEIYAGGLPERWREMSAAEAGRNAVKMMLYYAILRARSARESQRTIALYNTYGFGYALGMNFRNNDGKRDMLWPEDLEEIAADGATRHGCTIK